MSEVKASLVKSSVMAAFARQLRAWRVKKGWSQVDLGLQVNYSDALISGIENNHKTPTADFAARCDIAFDTPGTFADLQELIAREAWPSFYGPAIQFEQRAVRIHGWSPIVAPGILQTEDYARSVISAGLPFLSASELELRVKERLKRREILQRESGNPKLWEVISEGALRHVIGSPDIQRAQLDFLIEVAETTDVVLQLLPFVAHDNPGTDGPIRIFDFQKDPSVAYTECDGGGMLMETPELVTTLTTKMNLIRAAALSPHESLRLLHTIRDEIA
jgi:transcriptional regulator with XRE-family HTH domain